MIYRFDFRTCGKLFLFLILSVIPLVHGKEEKSSFSCVTWDDMGFENILYRKGKKTMPLELRNGRRSELYPLNSEGTFELYIREATANGELKLIGRTTFQPGARRMLFLIAKAGPKSELPLAIRGIDDSLSTFPPGTFRFANFTKQSLKVAFGNVVEDLRPAQIQVYQARMAPNGGLMSLIVMDTTGKPIFARRLFGQPRDRSMVFITPSQTSPGELSIRILPEIVPAGTSKKE